jgi:hypothetical protein
MYAIGQRCISRSQRQRAGIFSSMNGSDGMTPLPPESTSQFTERAIMPSLQQAVIIPSTGSLVSTPPRTSTSWICGAIRLPPMYGSRVLST